MNRSQSAITKSDLKKLLRLARSDIDAFFDRNPGYRHYQGREVLVALCQGAALHFLDKKNGVKDFDVWFFYPSGKPVLPYRRRGVVDFGESKFGVHPKMKREGFVGRTIDVLMRSNSAFSGKSPESEIVNYLTNTKTKTAKLLSAKAVIGLYPDRLLGKQLWP